MGIPFYFGSLYKKYSNTKLMVTERDIAQQTVDHLFLDYNSMIHPCAYQALAAMDNTITHTTEAIEQDIIHNTIMYTRYIIGLLRPKSLYVMIDGVAPRAKINQQRERRYKSSFLKKIQSVSDTTPAWDSNKITPGTEFMSKLRSQLDNLRNECQNTTHICISDSDEPGEGEHKMMKYIINNLNNHKAGENILIYGLDADLIMLSLMNIPCEMRNVILIRDNTFNEKLKECERTFTYLDIKTLGRAIYEELTSLYKQQVGRNGGEMSLRKENLIQDYVFLCFMLGNDFMEHIPSLLIKENGIGILTKHYINALVKFESYLIQGKNILQERINLNMLVSIFENLSACEEYFFKKVYSVYKTSQPVYRDTLDVTLSYDGGPCHFLQQDVIQYNKDGYKERYYNYYNIQNVDQLCMDYIEGLHWICGYYNNHEHNNWTWFFNHHATPFVSDLYNFLRNSQTMDKMKTTLHNTTALNASNPNTTLEQLLMVLPRDSLLPVLSGILDKKSYHKVVRVFRTNMSDGLERYYPTKITLDLINKEWLWQSKVLFDTFEKDILKHIL